MTAPVSTALPFDNHRTTPLAGVGPFVAGLKHVGVDYLWLWDELSGWSPKHLWTPENSPLASLMDQDATHDPFIEAAFAIAADPTVNVRLSTDAVRSAPAELMRKLYSLQSATSEVARFVVEL